MTTSAETLLDAQSTAPLRDPDRAERAHYLDLSLAGLTTLEARIAEIVRQVPGRIAFSSSLGLEDQAITHAIFSGAHQVDVFTLDTGRHFPETLDTLFETEARYGRKIRVLFPESADVEALVADDGINGFRYSVDARLACCDVRKVRPLNRALNGAGGWITGRRRQQSVGRASVPLAAVDDVHGLITLNPIADWTRDQVLDYIATHKIPLNVLHHQGFPSIGCQPCTRAIRPGEDERAGRWWWENENGKECGLHTQSSHVLISTLPSESPPSDTSKTGSSA